MPRFGQVQEQAQARLPPGAVTVPPSAWNPEWEDRPKDDVCLGLRPVPPRDLEDARKAAADVATRLYPRASEGEPFLTMWLDHFNDMLVRTIVARGTCDPNDVTEPWDGWRDDPDDLARMQLETSGAQFIFDAWERMRLEYDITIKPASNEDLEDLADRCEEIEKLPRDRAQRLRRLIAFCKAEIDSLLPEASV